MAHPPIDNGEDVLLVRGSILRMGTFASIEADAGPSGGMVRVTFTGEHPAISTVIPAALARSLARDLNGAAQRIEEKTE